MSTEKKLTLEDGRIVTASPKKLKVRDLIEARRQAGGKEADDTSVGFAIIARSILIDGKAANFEDILDISLADVGKVQDTFLDDLDLPGKKT